ncbi:LEA type 2 family protein [Lacinutrix sp.]|uniref:LEA type 2 family protein n=1 Tax=Lacinutrix sp. TaxID=1937692 RepID=UPI002604F49F|nr:LEA type 2 family protein [Lacinutrix sp.]MDG1715151.1 LEA type 2 family protein [Lacinutrix sp.]
MKKLIILLTISICFLSCTIKEKPEFLRVENINVQESNSEFIVLTADAFFNNPNTVGGTLETDGITITVNNMEVGTVSSKAFKVPAKKEFSIPLSANIPTKKLLNLNNLSGLLNSVLNKSMKVQYKGDIKYKIFGFSHKYTVDEIEDIKIKI